MYLDDKIRANAYVMNTPGFLSLTRDERKVLVNSILEELLTWFNSTVIVNKRTGRPFDRSFDKHDLVLTVLINDVVENEAGDSIRFFLPLDLGVGQAGYVNGQFVYSESYYLNIQVIDGRARTGDPSKFAIKTEKGR